MKRIAAIHDLSGIGKCSLTAAIPVISAAGIECNPVPTAVLSSHTGEMEGYTFLDLTDNMQGYCRHWKSLGITPDAIYTGYLGSLSQIEVVKNIIDDLSSSETAVVVDPAMADSGIMYKGFTADFASAMKELCRKADYILPNITEACFLTGAEYKTEYNKQYIESIISELSSLVKKGVILTGVSFSPDKIGCAVFDKSNSSVSYYFTEKYGGVYYGTGDLFASAFTAGITKEFSLNESAETALEFVHKSIRETYLAKTDTRFGVAFENHLNYIYEKYGRKI